MMSEKNCVVLALTVLLAVMWSAVGQEESVRPGINDKFVNDPDPSKWVERFEKEGREIYEKRDEIVAECDIQAGEDVADIGAGTGLFTRLFAPLAGKEGKVYAIDIAKTFVDHTVMSCHVRGMRNVKGVVCKQDDVGLPADSIDVAFVCATYHHFEFPFKSLDSIHRALRPGGLLVVVDFERIEGKSSDFILGHVRAGKEVVMTEIAKGGFELIEDKEEMFEENYLLRYRKVDEGKTADGS